jgi:hypothetical protein
MGHHVYLWSSGGNSYAASAARLLDVEDLILDCFGKSAPPPVSVDFVVDDDPGVADHYGGYTVAAFSGDAEDRELMGVPAAVEASDPERSAWPG